MTNVLIVGAGPTGLVLSLWLTGLGVKARIIDKTAEPGTTSRALAVHARTLELYRQLDLADSISAATKSRPSGFGSKASREHGSISNKSAPISLRIPSCRSFPRTSTSGC